MGWNSGHEEAPYLHGRSEGLPPRGQEISLLYNPAYSPGLGETMAQRARSSCAALNSG
jgi:hypothetical protein